MLVRIREPVDLLREGLRTGRSWINTTCRCFNRTASARRDVGSKVSRQERELGAERTRETHRKFTTSRQSALRFAVTRYP